MIRIITNSQGSGDWTVVKQGDETLFEGHRVTTMELASILEQLGHETDIVDVTDEQMEEGAY